MSAATKSGKPPAELQALPAWLVWKFEQLPGEPKARKVPYWTNGQRRRGAQGGENDRAHLVTYDAARRDATERGFDGVGLAVLPDWNITALDFDACCVDGVVNRDVAAMLAGTYAEYSPSGKGVHAFVTGQLTNEKSHANATQFGFEEFSTKGFVTFTGNALAGASSTIAAPSAALLALHAERFGSRIASDVEVAPQGLTLERIGEYLAAVDPGLGYHDWLSVLMGVHHETQGSIEGLVLVDDWSARSGKYPGREVIELKWDGFGQGGGGRQVTIGKLQALAREAGSEIGQRAEVSEFNVIPEPAAPAGEHFPVSPLSDFLRDVRPVSWLIKGFLPSDGLGVLYGESQSGKSFLAFDMACAIGRGVEWNGKRVKRGRVLYLVAEGVRGFEGRVRAYCHQHAIDPSDIQLEVMHRRMPRLHHTDQVKLLVEELPTRGKYDLVAVDTLAQATPGANENSGEDMGVVVMNCQAIGKAAGDAMVLLIHHSGKDASKGARGHSSLRAACDVELEVTRLKDVRTVSVTKMKDGRDGARFGFHLLDVVLGEDEDGDDITSCVVGYSDSTVSRESVTLGKNEKIVLGEFHTYLDANVGQGVPFETLKMLAAAQLTCEAPRNQAKQSINSLIKKGLLREVGDLLFAPDD